MCRCSGIHRAIGVSLSLQVMRHFREGERYEPPGNPPRAEMADLSRMASARSYAGDALGLYRRGRLARQAVVATLNTWRRCRSLKYRRRGKTAASQAPAQFQGRQGRHGVGRWR